MQKIRAFWHFYLKVFIPCMAFAVIAGLFVSGINETRTLSLIAVSYFLFSPFFQYMIYDFRKRNEYFFYQNIGLSKLFLWVSSMSVSFIIHLSLRLI